MYIYTFLLILTDTVTFQNIDRFSWDTVYNEAYFGPTCFNPEDGGSMFF
jgi:hypothetical protein